MVALVLLGSGFVATAFGAWRGYAEARAALLPLARPGDPTRTLVEGSKPIRSRARVQLAARHVALSLAWLAVAMYGLLLITVGLEVPG